MLKPPRYQVYLLRCWEERSSHAHMPTIWRYSLEDSQTGEVASFRLTGDEASFLVDRLVSRQPDALLTHLRSTLSRLPNECGITQHRSE